MENEIKVSVIIPIYNAYEYLRPAMDSVTNQTLREIEIICVDDGSTDHSLEIIKEYQAADDRIRIVTENNAGVAIARNNGIRRARGEYVAFLDADDFIAPDCLEKMYVLAKEKDLDIAIAQYDIFIEKLAKFTPAIPPERAEIYREGKVTSKSEYPDDIFQSTDGYVWNKIFKRTFLIEKELVFLQDARMFEDVYFVCTALSLAERVAKIPRVLFHHRVYSESARNRLFRRYYDQVPLVYAKIKEHLVAHGMFLPLQSSFMNLAATRIYKIYNLLGSDEREDLYNLLHEQYAETLGWGSLSEGTLRDAAVSEFCANVALYTYEEYARRERRGLKVKLKNLSRRIRLRIRQKNFSNFFKKMFAKKEL